MGASCTTSRPRCMDARAVLTSPLVSVFSSAETNCCHHFSSCRRGNVIILPLPMLAMLPAQQNLPARCDRACACPSFKIVYAAQLQVGHGHRPSGLCFWQCCRPQSRDGWREAEDDFAHAFRFVFVSSCLALLAHIIG